LSSLEFAWSEEDADAFSAELVDGVLEGAAAG
jgi:hypothetical protein